MALYQTLQMTPGPVSTLTLSRPDALNALNAAMLTELAKALEELEAYRHNDQRTRCLIVKGAGERAFAAGADVAAMRGMAPEQARELSHTGQSVFSQLARFFAPTVAVVQGFALGGGLELALACDFIVAGDRASFALPEVSLGLVPGFGGTRRIRERLGRQGAMRLALLGERIGAREALSLGLVAEVVEQEALVARVEAISHRFVQMSAEALFAAKRLVSDSAALSPEAAEASERGAFAALMATEEAQKAIEQFLRR